MALIETAIVSLAGWASGKLVKPLVQFVRFFVVELDHRAARADPRAHW
jgi:hypothetical protein